MGLAPLAVTSTAAAAPARPAVSIARPAPVSAVRAHALSPTAAQLRWQRADRGATVVRRAVGLAPVRDVAAGVPVATTDATRLVDRGLVPGHTYTWTLFARGRDGATAAGRSVTIALPRSVARPAAHPHAAVSPAATGTITGTVTAAATGAPVRNVAVVFYRPNGDFVTEYFTGPNGVYTASVGQTTAGYTVCFDPTNLGTPATGYAAQCYANQPWNPNQEVPSGVTPVPVSAGGVSGGIDAALQVGGALAGKVTASDGTGLGGVAAELFETNGDYVTGLETNADGTYRVRALQPGAYVVCFDATNAVGGPSNGGYRSQCYRGVTWSATENPPAAATPVTVTSGATKGGVNAKLPSAGAIRGVVTGEDSAPLSTVYVSVFQASGAYVSSSFTGDDGAYDVPGLPANAKGYVVCFDAAQATGPAAGGYRDECYADKPWDNLGDLPAGVTKVPVANGSAVTVNASLALGAGIAGTVTSSGAGVADVNVEAFAADDTVVASALTDSDGAYQLLGLAGGSYRICFYTSNAASGTGYLPQCWNGVPWDLNNPPAGAASVSAAVGAVTSGIDAALDRAGAIAGKVVAATGGAALRYVDVSVLLADGSYVTDVSTGDDGAYRITGLAPGTYYVCFDGAVALGGSSQGGYLGQCWQNAAWPVGSDPTGTPVTVTAGATRSGISARLKSAAAISGTVRAAGGAPVRGVDILVFDAAGDYVAGSGSYDDGTYTAFGLAPTRTYRVCFDTSGASADAGGVGYADQCYDSQPWNGGLDAPSPGATALSVAAGANRGGVDATLTAGSAVAGTVTSAATGTGLDAFVSVYDGSGFVAGAETAADGSYTVNGITPSASGYAVCFRARARTGTGFAAQCWQNQPWTGQAPPSGATFVLTTAGQTVDGIDAALSAGGALAGKATGDGAPVSDVHVVLYDSAGRGLGDTFTLANGTYRFANLTPSSYLVCFEIGSPWTSQCYRNKPWTPGSPPPATATAVAVSAGQTTGSINATLQHSA